MAVLAARHDAVVPGGLGLQRPPGDDGIRSLRKTIWHRRTALLEGWLYVAATDRKGNGCFEHFLTVVHSVLMSKARIFTYF